jgi:hypothetical protein
MTLIQNSILVVGLSVLFRLFLLYSDINKNPNKEEYEPLYEKVKYEVTFKSQVYKNDSLYYAIIVIDPEYNESARVVTEKEYNSLSKGSTFKERVLHYNVDLLYWFCNLFIFVLFLSLFAIFSTSKTFVLFSLKEFKEE